MGAVRLFEAADAQQWAFAAEGVHADVHERLALGDVGWAEKGRVVAGGGV